MFHLNKLYIIFIVFLSIILCQPASEVYYMRYFENDHNFKSDLSMLSSSRRGKPHLAVSYNEKDQPIKIENLIGQIPD